MDVMESLALPCDTVKCMYKFRRKRSVVYKPFKHRSSRKVVILRQEEGKLKKMH